MKKIVFIFILISIIAQSRAIAQTASGNLTIESYYKVKWGYADEFIALWKKNHYPLLKKLQDKGDIVSIKAEAPVLHSSEDSRWDFKVAITFKNEHLALDYSIIDPFKKDLYPDQEGYKKAEQHRFELLISHWDVIVEAIPLPQ
ncbi:hypothetical protein JN11_03389 [Mucilaginibacter frigoritolerans]|uniref:EthD domain-containing protein n=1 Tax=Mucilaginibacter frigoritolerans TaxID=652788 RepID=A0A562TVC8_9SPHI|nr:hypothetical protein [Mucilaginibacter frigoritolerans]TWI97569.1 hypothetical protein JN11_03389 [Mucilaginibacter frigoritolerans]